jgi:hypothetical protein
LTPSWANPAMPRANGFTATWLWPSSANGCLQQIAANRFSTPQDVIAILLQGFVRASLFAFQLRTTPRRAARCRDWILPALTRPPIHSQDRSKDSAVDPRTKSLNDSRQPHRTRLRNSLPQDDAPHRPREEPQSRERESMSLLGKALALHFFAPGALARSCAANRCCTCILDLGPLRVDLRCSGSGGCYPRSLAGLIDVAPSHVRLEALSAPLAETLRPKNLSCGVPDTGAVTPDPYGAHRHCTTHRGVHHHWRHATRLWLWLWHPVP